MKWSPQQDHALQEVSRWLKSNEQVFCLFGYAGVGKTTLAKHFADSHRKRTLYAAFTGKAAHVLRTKGCTEAKTLHSLIYRPAGETKQHEMMLLEQRISGLRAKLDSLSIDPAKNAQEALELIGQIETFHQQMRTLQSESSPRWALWANSPLAEPDVDLLVVDEVSMVDERVGKDLESFGKKILVLGDPAQLPPVGAGGYYTRREPNVLLTEVHRHARESGILRLATAVREGARHVGPMIWGDDCRVLDDSFLDTTEKQRLMLEADQVLVGRNETRRRFNATIRQLLGRRKILETGDRLVCLKNDRELGVYNGSQWVVQSVEEISVADRTATVMLRSEDDSSIYLVAAIWLHHLLGEGAVLGEMGWDRADRAEFDYAYAMTVHKSQGSQWDKVVLCDESRAFRGDAQRWLYTGMTRASRELTVIL